MDDRVLVKSGSQSTGGFFALCFLPALILLAGGLIYSGYYYQNNMDFCRQYSEPGQCLLTYENSYLHIMKCAMQFGKFSIWIPVFMYSGMAWLVGGICCSLAYGPGELCLSENFIQGKAKFRNTVCLSVKAVKEIRRGPMGSLVVLLPGGKVIFPHLKNREEICRAWENREKQKAAGDTEKKNREQKPGPHFHKKINGYLGLICILIPVLLLIGAIMLGWDKLQYHWSYFWSSDRLQERQLFISYVLGSVLCYDMGKGTTEVMGLFALSLPFCVYFYRAYGKNELTLTGERIWGKSRFGGCLSLPSEELLGSALSPRGILTLYTGEGKSVFGGFSNPRKAYEAAVELMGMKKSPGEKRK